MGNLRVTLRELSLVRDILHSRIPNHVVWAFGSRVHGENLKPFSDLDLVVLTETPLKIECLLDLKDAFRESDLPFKVDLLDWATLDKRFQKLIQQHYLVVQGATNLSS